MSHELSKLTTIESDASVHVCPLKHGQGCGFRKPNETRPLPGAEMQQGGMRQVSHDTEVGRVTAVYRVLDMCRIRVPTGPATPTAVERTFRKASRHALYRRWCRWCAAARAADKPHLREQQSETDEAVSRIEFYSAELEREEDRTLSTSSLNAFDDGSESLTATLCSTKAFSEHLTETTLAFVKVLGHSVMMLHSDQEPVLVQLLKTVQSRRFERTSVTHGPRTSHQSQSKIENVNQVITGVCWSMWLSLENLLARKNCQMQHSVGLADSSRCVELDEVSGEERQEKRTFCVFLARLARVTCHSEKE